MPNNSDRQVIELDGPISERGSLHPIELEAIAKMSKVATELNKLLAEQDFDAINISWDAFLGNELVAYPNSDFPGTVSIAL